MDKKVNWDAVGVGASVACAVHCAVLPLMLTSLPVLGINLIDNAGFEYGMIGLALCIGFFALWQGFRKHHGQFRPFLIFGAGMIFLFAKQYWHSYQLWLLPFAIFCITAAHFLNFRLSRTAFRTQRTQT
jgi:hypothetical protein